MRGVGAFAEVTVGKVVGGHWYFHVSALSEVPTEWQVLIARAIALVDVKPETDFNVIKLSQSGADLSLLCYRDFFDDPFPALQKSWRVSLSQSSVTYRTYEESANPPILHRKELLLPSSDPRVPIYEAMTQTAETIGLFSEVNRIGFRAHWYALIAQRGYKLVDSKLVPQIDSVSAAERPILREAPKMISRHLTALSRSSFSTPVQALLRHGLLDGASAFFDYGCGRGDDVRNLRDNGVNASGWDPYYMSGAPCQYADVVNIGFVINVIEDIEERAAALRRAYSFTRGILSVAAMLTSQIPADGNPYKDGYFSSRKTFQKYFSQAQLREFIEETLNESAIAAGPGIYFVFRDKDLEQRFLLARYGQRPARNVFDPSFIPYRRITNPGRVGRSTRVQSSSERAAALFETHRELFESLWLQSLSFGRIPEKQELPAEFLVQVEKTIGSVAKASSIISSRYDQTELERARRERVSDLIVFGALQQFRTQARPRELEPRIRTDIRYFFGDYKTWQVNVREVLFGIPNVEEIDHACRNAAGEGWGWLVDGQSLQFHIDTLTRLPVLLRVYVACATLLFGDIAGFDLVKIHIRSGKVTLLRYDDFEHCPLPRLMQRVKVKLRVQDFDVFSYDNEYMRTVLYYKSRYIDERWPRYAEQKAFESKLDALGLFDLSGYGPAESELLGGLSRARWQVDGFALVRSSSAPSLDDPCGANFTYRQLIECGETQQSSGMTNLPNEPDSYTALLDLAQHILDPVVEYFGMVKLTYGFCSQALARAIPGKIAPELDQHAAHEKKRNGRFVCSRLGAACDFIIEDENMEDVAMWIYENLKVDRIYIYGPDRPIHVSYALGGAREMVRLVQTSSGRTVPRVIKKRQSQAK